MKASRKVNKSHKIFLPLILSICMLFVLSWFMGLGGRETAIAAPLRSTTFINAAPIANDDVYTTTEYVALNVSAPGVLDNDIDPDGGTLTATLATNTSNGSVALNPDGAFVYEPSPGFSGVDTFTYMAANGEAPSFAYWPFEEGSGITTTDVTENGYDGTLVNGPIFTSTVPITPTFTNNYAIENDGVDDYIQTPAIDLANRSFSVAFWARRDSIDASHFIVGQGSVSSNYGLHIGFRSNNLFTCAFWNNDLNTPTTHTNSNWHHWACTYDAATNERIIYQDGVAVASDTASADYQGSGDFFIGSRFDGVNSFDGLYDDVRLYLTPLTDAQVAAAMNEEQASFGALATVSINVTPILDSMLVGEVTDNTNGNSIADATIVATFNPIAIFTETTTISGTYSFTIPEETYTVTASAYGYDQAQITAVSVLPNITTTLDFSLDPADTYVVDGVVTDTNTGWPLYASIDIDGYPGDPIWTNPETGYYSITLPAGIAYTFQTQAWVAGYLSESRAVGFLTGNTTENFALDINSSSCNAPGYSDGSGSCLPTAGGLIVGHAYDNNTLTPLTGTAIENEDGYATSTQATPADDNVEDGFYTIFSPAGSKTFTATQTGGYSPDIASVSVVMSDTTVHDFYLDAGWLTASHGNLGVILPMGLSTTLPLTLSNLGSVDADFEFFEIENEFTPVLLNSDEIITDGTIEWLYRDTKGIPVSDTDSGASIAYPGAYRYTPNKAATADLNILVYTDDWVHTAPNTLVQQAISILDLSATVHINGDYTGFQNSLNNDGPWDLVVWSGENNTINTAVLSDLLTYLQGGGKLVATYWRQLNIPNDPLWEEMGFTYVSNYITPPPAYWWEPGHPLFSKPEDAPEWINRVQNSGTSQGTRLEPLSNGIALAGYTTSATTNEAGIILRDDSMALYKGLRDVSTNADDNGNSILDGTELWVNIFQYMLYGAEVPWVSEDPITGTVSSLANTAIDITFDAGAVSQPGEYHADLIVSNDTPYAVAQIPVTMTVVPLTGWGKVAGTLNLLGHCDINPAPFAGHELLISGSSGFTTTVTTDENGYYQWWIEASESPLTVTVAPISDYSDGLVSGINVADGMTTTVDFDLRWLQPCISTTPDVYSATLNFGESITFPFTIENSGAISASYQLSDVSTEFTPALLRPVRIPAIELPYSPVGDSFAGLSPQGQQAKTIESWLYTPSPHALTSSAQPDVLLFASDNVSTIQAMLSAYPDIGSVDYFDARNGTPTLAHLQAYDSVVVLSNTSFADQAAAGDVLADYLDTGGTVVQTNGTWDTGGGWLLTGRYLSDGYSPYEYGGNLYFDPVNLGTYDASHPIMAGVSSATDNSLHQDLILKPEATFVANWDDGEGLAASLGSVVGLNIFVTDSGNWSGDIDLILHNSITWLTQGDAPWLLQDPISGTVDADTGSAYVDIIMDTAYVDQPGEYLATLRLSTNDPVNNNLTYPVTMTVNTPSTWGEIEGTVTQFGYCNTPSALSFHEILIEGSSGFTATTTTNLDGSYIYWIDEAESPITVTVSAIPEYSSSMATDIIVTAGQTTLVDLDTYWLQPCVTVDPESYEKVLFLGDVETDTLDLANGGNISANFVILETSTLSWLSTDPVSGTIETASMESADVIFDSSVLTQTGRYNGELQVDSNDPINGSVLIPIEMEVVSGTTGVAIAPDSVLAGLPGMIVTHTFNVANTGTVTDIYDLTLNGNSWTTTDPPATTSFMGPGELFTFTVAVTIPDDPTLMSAIIGSDMFMVTAVSQLDGTNGTTTGTTLADVETGVAVFEDQAATVYVGETATYSVLVTNTGEFTDTFTLSTSGNVWTTELSMNTLTLGSGQSGLVDISVTVPLSASDGDTDEATITATSQLDNLATDAVLLVTTAQEHFIYLPIVSKQ